MERRLVDWTAGRIGFAAGRRGLHLGRHAVQPPGAAPGAGARRAATGARRRTSAASSSPPRRATSASQKSALLLGLRRRRRGRGAHRRRRPDGPRGARRRARHARGDDRGRRGVVATAGTTDRGRIDPLAAIADLCDARRRLAARRRRLRLRAAGLPHAPAPARRDRAGPVRHRRLPQVLLPARLLQRADRARAGATSPPSPGTPTTSTRRTPSEPEPGRQVAADHPPLRRAQALDHAARARRGRHRRRCSTPSATWPPPCTTTSTATPTSGWSAAPS